MEVFQFVSNVLLKEYQIVLGRIYVSAGASTFVYHIALHSGRVSGTLPEEILTSQTLCTFCQQLKTWLFRKSYPNIII